MIRILQRIGAAVFTLLVLAGAVSAQQTLQNVPAELVSYPDLNHFLAVPRIINSFVRFWLQRSNKDIRMFA